MLFFKIAHRISDTLTDAYWSIAGSSIVLAALLLGAIGLRVGAAFIPGEYRGFAKVGSVVCLLCFGINLGHRIADNTAALRQARTDLAFTESQLENMKASEADKARLAKEAAGNVTALQLKVRAYGDRISQLAGNKSCGAVLSRADSDELRAIARGKTELRELSIFDRVRGIGRGN